MIQTIKIMISSTRQDLAQYREVASAVITQLANEKKERVQLIEISMEEKSQSGERETALAVSKGWVDESNWLVLIVGWWYGTISPEAEANGQSITEFEYRYAMELKKSQPERKVFVFLTGNENTPEEYRVSSDETFDLKNWLGKEQDKNKLVEFRSQLTKNHATFFNNIHVFREKLRLALQKNIDTLPKPLPLGPFLGLILDLQAPIDQCISRVNQLRIYKTIHDHLHEMRQKVIRPIREGILPQWEEQEILSRKYENRLNHRVIEGGVLQGRIKGMMDNLGNESKSLFGQLKIVVDTNLLGEEDVEEPNITDFRVKLEEFSINVQMAFTEANTLMQRQANLLNKFNDELFNKINDRRTIPRLTPEQNEWLSPEFNTIAAEKKRFLDVLNTHDNWQKLHDGLEMVDGFKETNFFQTRLRQFCKTQTVTFTNEINAEIQRLKNEDPDNPIQNCIEQLKVYWDEINKSISIETYEAMRKEFDDIFYFVDKCTFEEVKKAGECAEGFKQLLETLRAQEQEKQSSL
ncbi:MAG: DUF4062 domain-containing protein [Gammaproteobacteria bacterium]